MSDTKDQRISDLEAALLRVAQIHAESVIEATGEVRDMTDKASLEIDAELRRQGLPGLLAD